MCRSKHIVCVWGRSLRFRLKRNKKEREKGEKLRNVPMADRSTQAAMTGSRAMTCRKVLETPIATTTTTRTATTANATSICSSGPSILPRGSQRKWSSPRDRIRRERERERESPYLQDPCRNPYIKDLCTFKQVLRTSKVIETSGKGLKIRSILLPPKLGFGGLYFSR